MNPDEALSGTPYLIENSPAARQLFETKLKKSRDAQIKAGRAMDKIRQDAQSALSPYLTASYTELVTESNEMEGMNWELEETRAVIATHKELLDAPTHTLQGSIHSDKRVYEVLGLYKAHELADQWARKNARTPILSEIRYIQNLIVGDIYGAGQFKLHANKISGTNHRTAEPFDVNRVMLELADWWKTGTDDPILTATVIHAWLAHIHPFDDGNGRTARVLANLELARHGYPPLIIRPAAHRGEYYRALACSDEGDILPLYELFTNAIHQQSRLMLKDGYVSDIIQNRFLATNRQRHKMWQSLMEQFSADLDSAAKEHSCEFSLKGISTLQDFSLLQDFDPSGNSWFATIRVPEHQDEWLLWFGFQSEAHRATLKEEPTHPTPSIFISRRDTSPYAEHPFTRDFNRPLGSKVPDEVTSHLGLTRPIEIRVEHDRADHISSKAAELLVRSLREHSKYF